MYDPGTYWGKVTNQQLGTTSNGNPQFVLSFSVRGIVDPADPEGELLGCPPGERSVYRVITDKTIAFVLEDLARLGFEGDDFAQLDLQTPGCQDFTGLELAFFCQQDTYDGKVREKWGLARGGGANIKPLESSDLRSLNAMFGKELKAQSRELKKTKKEYATAPPTDPEPTTPPLNAETVATEAEFVDGDIPF